ncbi:hypothetical protein QBC47DRAFT_72737 [Echria macrotheca]|uniref:CRIB domain-containing protein n=1 Tax=Echria macrotheca TaxID=438768 RepID=A0AAJ0B940_9PEZI|nr:hypothetical protein QBC47DRAFT_72737 [Echria macrotheca]
MNSWAFSDLPSYQVALDHRRKAAEKKAKYSLRGRSNSSATVAFMPAPEAIRHDSESIRGLLEPAIDGPPSPESLRALSNQMKQSSGREKHQSHHASTSSGSSSLRSLASADRPSWDNALDGLTLSRKSSGRSVTGSMPSRDRPESVQVFGKSLFSRRAKLKRGDSGPNSASSSVYSTDAVGDALISPPPTSAPIRDSVIPSLFGRRRTATLDNVDEGAVRRKFNISGPYNFQHVAHTQKDHLPDLQRADRVTLASELSQLRGSQAPAPGTAPRGTRADDLHFADFSSDFLPLHEEAEDEVGAEPRNGLNLIRPPSGVLKRLSPPRRLIKQTRSQEQLRVPPPRPPRSPIDPAMGVVPTPPVPPPRVSSRASIRPDGFDSLGAVFSDRPQTSGGFRHAQPFAGGSSDSNSPPATSHGYAPGPDMNTILEHGHSRSESFPNDGNWPLPCITSPSFDASLPGVPEEEETAAVFRRSRASVASNSSLRGSQSVPMLRRMSISQDESPRRPPSNASDTLGRFDLLAAQRALKAALIEGGREDSLTRESWEDDIDYCYDHEAEADCDFAWDRPSLDLSRDCDSTTPVKDQFRASVSCEASPAMLTPAQFDVPALSPVSQMSAATAHEAITPTLTLSKTSNFSLPRAEVTTSTQLLHVRKPSNASSFKESHGFTLSPSLLIPKDYEREMMAAEAEAREYAFHPFDEPALNFDATNFQGRYRTSASTTGTLESMHSNFEKHVSVASSATDFTRLTASTGSLEIDSQALKSEPFPAFDTHIRPESKGAMPTLPESEEMGAAPPVPRKDFSSRSSESNLLKLAMNEPHKRKDSIQTRRQRARTTSLSTPPPPNQYALFPSTHLGGPRI